VELSDHELDRLSVWLVNPSVYCDDLYATFQHIARVLDSHVYVVKPDKEWVKLAEELARASVL